VDVTNGCRLVASASVDGTRAPAMDQEQQRSSQRSPHFCSGHDGARAPSRAPWSRSWSAACASVPPMIAAYSSSASTSSS